MTNEKEMKPDYQAEIEGLKNFAAQLENQMDELALSKQGEKESDFAKGFEMGQLMDICKDDKQGDNSGLLWMLVIFMLVFGCGNKTEMPHISEDMAFMKGKLDGYKEAMAILK